MRKLAAFGVLAALIPIACGSAAADAKGTAILRQAFAKLHAARTYRADLTMVQTSGRLSSSYRGTLEAMKPNLLRITMKGRMAPFYVSDGKAYYSGASGGRFYQKRPLSAKTTEFLGEWEGEVDAFFGGAALVAKVKADYAGSTRIDGKDCDMIRATMRDPERSMVYTIGRKDHVIYKAVLTMTQGGRSATQVNTLSAIKFNAPMKREAFAFKPGPGMRLLPERPAPARDRIGL